MYIKGLLSIANTKVNTKIDRGSRGNLLSPI